MLFKKKVKQPQEDNIAPPALMDGEKPTSTGATGEDGVAADESKDPKRIETDISYPSGLKLALLMISIFIGMFLVSLVRYLSAFVSTLR